MGRIVKQCNKCGRICAVCNENTLIDKINDCGGSMIDTGISFEDFNIIRKISSDDLFFNAMSELKKSNIIEYNLKMSQFKTQLNQQKQQQETNKLRCPKCGSTSITAGARGVNFTWGLIGASKTVNRCANCGHTWKP